MAHTILVVCAVNVLMVHYVRGFPQGAPVEACDSMLPRHVHTKPRPASESPFYLLAAASHYDDSNRKGIRVEIGGAPFKGFFVVAIDPHTGKRIGDWAEVKGTDVLPCSAVTHIDNHPKRYASFLWIPPDLGEGDVVFVATVVESYAVYYAGIASVVPGETVTSLDPSLQSAGIYKGDKISK